MMPVKEALSKLARGGDPFERRVLWYLTGKNRNTHMTTAEIAAEVKAPVWVVDRIKEDFQIEVRILRTAVKLAMQIATDSIALDRAVRRLEGVLDRVESGDLDPESLGPCVVYLRSVIGAMQSKYIDDETRKELDRDLCGYPSVVFDPDGPFAKVTDILDLEAGETWTKDDLPRLRSAAARCGLISTMMTESFNVTGGAINV